MVISQINKILYIYQQQKNSLENSEQQKTWKAKLEHLLKFKSPSLKTNYLKINFSIN